MNFRNTIYRVIKVSSILILFTRLDSSDRGIDSQILSYSASDMGSIVSLDLSSGNGNVLSIVSRGE